MVVISRRRFVASAPAVLGGASVLSACSQASHAEAYEAVAARTWQAGSPAPIEGAALGQELVRYATLSPSSHNTPCWKFAVQDRAITILPDLSRRCPAVDPNDHHIFVSPGRAAENLMQAAAAHGGLRADPGFDATQDAIRITLTPVPAQVSPPFRATATSSHLCEHSLLMIRLLRAAAGRFDPAAFYSAFSPDFSYHASIFAPFHCSARCAP